MPTDKGGGMVNIPANEIRITSGGKVRMYITYAVKQLSVRLVV
jgi:hypothetical protein